MKLSPAGEIGAVYGAVAFVTLLVSHAPLPLAHDYGHLILAASFLFGALSLARRQVGGARRFGIDLEGVLEADPEERPGLAGHLELLRRALPSTARELGLAVLCALLIFPPYVLAFRLWHGVEHPFTFHGLTAPIDFMLNQLIVVALPEEALFRGYFQTRLSDLCPRHLRLGRVSVPITALIVQAALFAILHFLVGFHPVRLSVFFPALLFGVLRAARGGIGAAVWFHAFSNLLSEIVTRGYL